MLASASDYLRTAKLLWGQHNLSSVAIVNAAIAIEILKSFVAQPSENNRKGTVSEQYQIKGKRLHTLTELAGAIDPETIKSQVFHEHEESNKDIYGRSQQRHPLLITKLISSLSASLRV